MGGAVPSGAVEENLLELIPERAVVAEGRVDSRVRLSFPRSRGPVSGLLRRLLGRSREFHLKLDSLSSSAWELIDGRRDVQAIGEEISRRFGDEAEPLYPRLAEFLAILDRNRLIRWRGR
ncbi:MAG: PqqD family protein [Planctomycetota bacterium]